MSLGLALLTTFVIFGYILIAIFSLILIVIIPVYIFEQVIGLIKNGFKKI